MRRCYAEVLTSIDSNNVDENFRQVLDGATGEFKDMYSPVERGTAPIAYREQGDCPRFGHRRRGAVGVQDKAVVLLVDQSVSTQSFPTRGLTAAG